MLLRNQEAPISGGFNSKYNIDNLTYQKWLKK